MARGKNRNQVAEHVTVPDSQAQDLQDQLMELEDEENNDDMTLQDKEYVRSLTNDTYSNNMEMIAIYHQQPTADNDTHGGWELPVSPILVNPRRLKKLGITHPIARAYHRTVNFAVGGWQCDTKDWFPDGLAQSTPYSMAMLSAFRLLSLQTKHDLAFAQRLMTDARAQRLRDSNVPVDLPEHTSMVESTINIKNQCEKKIRENFFGLMCQDVVHAATQAEQMWREAASSRAQQNSEATDQNMTLKQVKIAAAQQKKIRKKKAKALHRQAQQQEQQRQKQQQAQRQVASRPASDIAERVVLRRRMQKDAERAVASMAPSKLEDHGSSYVSPAPPNSPDLSSSQFDVFYRDRQTGLVTLKTQDDGDLDFPPSQFDAFYYDRQNGVANYKPRADNHADKSEDKLLNDVKIKPRKNRGQMRKINSMMNHVNFTSSTGSGLNGTNGLGLNSGVASRTGTNSVKLPSERMDLSSIPSLDAITARTSDAELARLGQLSLS